MEAGCEEPCACCNTLLLLVQEFNPQSLSNVLWAFASLKHHPGNALLDGSAAHAVRCVDQFTPQVMLAFGFCCFNCQPPPPAPCAFSRVHPGCVWPFWLWFHTILRVDAVGNLLLCHTGNSALLCTAPLTNYLPVAGSDADHDCVCNLCPLAAGESADSSQ